MSFPGLADTGVLSKWLWNGAVAVTVDWPTTRVLEALAPPSPDLSKLDMETKLRILHGGEPDWVPPDSWWSAWSWVDKTEQWVTDWMQTSRSWTDSLTEMKRNWDKLVMEKQALRQLQLQNRDQTDDEDNTYENNEENLFEDSYDLITVITRDTTIQQPSSRKSEPPTVVITDYDDQAADTDKPKSQNPVVQQTRDGNEKAKTNKDGNYDKAADTDKMKPSLQSPVVKQNRDNEKAKTNKEEFKTKPPSIVQEMIRDKKNERDAKTDVSGDCPKPATTYYFRKRPSLKNVPRGTVARVQKQFEQTIQRTNLQQNKQPKLTNQLKSQHTSDVVVDISPQKKIKDVVGMFCHDEEKGSESKKPCVPMRSWGESSEEQDVAEQAEMERLRKANRKVLQSQSNKQQSLSYYTNQSNIPKTSTVTLHRYKQLNSESFDTMDTLPLLHQPGSRQGFYMSTPTLVDSYKSVDNMLDTRSEMNEGQQTDPMMWNNQSGKNIIDVNTYYGIDQIKDKYVDENTTLKEESTNNEGQPAVPLITDNLYICEKEPNTTISYDEPNQHDFDLRQENVTVEALLAEEYIALSHNDSQESEPICKEHKSLLCVLNVHQPDVSTLETLSSSTLAQIPHQNIENVETKEQDQRSGKFQQIYTVGQSFIVFLTQFKNKWAAPNSVDLLKTYLQKTRKIVLQGNNSKLSNRVYIATGNALDSGRQHVYKIFEQVESSEEQVLYLLSMVAGGAAIAFCVAMIYVFLEMCHLT